MKIAVIGETGLFGSKVAEKQKQKGHQAIAAAPNTGVNTIIGEELKEAMAGAKVASIRRPESAHLPSWPPVRTGTVNAACAFIWRIAGYPYWRARSIE